MIAAIPNANNGVLRREWMTVLASARVAILAAKIVGSSVDLTTLARFISRHFHPVTRATHPLPAWRDIGIGLIKRMATVTMRLCRVLGGERFATE